jgi:hypothetical protein
LRFRAGGELERVLVFPVFVLLGVVLVPGVVSVVVSLVAALV